MKKLRYSLAALMMLAAMTVPAYADIVGPLHPVRGSSVSVLVIAVIIIAAAVLVWAVLRKRKNK